MQKISAENRVIVSPTRVLRKLLEGESMQYDKECPTCRHQGMIAMWDVKQKRYTSYRCSDVRCKYGNTGFAPQLPVLEFVV